MFKVLFTLILSIYLLSSVQISYSQTVNLEKYKNIPQVITKVRIASAAIIPDKWQKETNWNRIEKMVRKAVTDGGADIVVTPEGVLEGYVVNEVRKPDLQNEPELLQKFFELSEPINGSYIKKACELADELNIYFLLGFLERRNKLLYNSAILIDPDGDIISKYSKTHFAQGYKINPDSYLAGEDYPVFDTPFGKIGILICYDRQLPEPARILAVKGAQVLFVPSYGSYTDMDGWNTILMRTRAYENRFPVIFCNPFQSLLINEKGDIKAAGNANEIVYYEINTAPERYKDRFKNRRPSTYFQLEKGSDPAYEKK